MGKASRRKKQRDLILSLDLHPEPDKISTRLGELVAPHVAEDETRDGYAALITLGAMAWNLSLVPAGERSATVAEIVRNAAKLGLPVTVQWMNHLIDRKLRLFPSDDRFIESWKVRAEPDGDFTLLVVAAL